VIIPFDTFSLKTAKVLDFLLGYFRKAVMIKSQGPLSDDNLNIIRSRFKEYLAGMNQGRINFSAVRERTIVRTLFLPFYGSSFPFLSFPFLSFPFLSVF